jgi:hypothetical protein
VDLAAQGRHRQQARRFRIREDRDVMLSPRRRALSHIKVVVTRESA